MDKGDAIHDVAFLACSFENREPFTKQTTGDPLESRRLRHGLIPERMRLLRHGLAMLGALLLGAPGFRAYGNAVNNPPTVHPVARVTIDGQFAEWERAMPLYRETRIPLSEIEANLIRIGLLQGVQTFGLRLQFDRIIDLQNFHNLTLYVDTDLNPRTGKPVGEIGADWSWTLGQRIGRTYDDNGNPGPLSHTDESINAAPSVMSREFEVGFELPIFRNDEDWFAGAYVALAVANPAGDPITEPAILKWELSRGIAIRPGDQMPERSMGSHVRAVSYNTFNDGPFDLVRGPVQADILRRLNPDLLALQEINRHDAPAIAAWLNEILPGEGSWKAEKFGRGGDGYGHVFATRRPILDVVRVEGSAPGRENGFLLIDLRPTVESRLLVGVFNPPCCEADRARQFEVDALMAALRDYVLPPADLEAETDGKPPMIIMGDSEFVGLPTQWDTVIAGDIDDNLTFGPDFVPDRGLGQLQPAYAKHLNNPYLYTYFDPEVGYLPGRLDYIFYGPSKLRLERAFVFDRMNGPWGSTPGVAMPDPVFGQEPHRHPGTAYASDHLPVVADLSVKLRE